MTFYQLDDPTPIVRTALNRGADNREADLDPDIALWQEIALSIWPFTGPPITGTWPQGWFGIDNTATPYVCTQGGAPGVWAPLSASAGATYIPGVTTGGTVDNLGAINSYLGTWAAANPQGGIPPLILPPGKIGVSGNLVPPAGVTLWGSGNYQRAPTGTSTADGGSTLVPTAGFAGTYVASLDNANSGLSQLNCDGLTTTQAVRINAVDCQLLNFSSMGEVGPVFDSVLGNANRLNITGRCDITSNKVSGAFVQCLNAQGLDWLVGASVRVTGGCKVINVGGSLWAGVHFTQGGPNASDAFICNVDDYGGAQFTGCYFDSAPVGATAQIVHQGKRSVYTGSYYFQNTAGLTGVPVISEQLGNAGAIVIGGHVAQPVPTSSWSAFMDGAGTGNIVGGIDADVAFATSFFTTSNPASSFGNMNGVNPAPNYGQLNIGGTTATTATAGAATLPANPLGFITVTINGTAAKIPYYST